MKKDLLASIIYRIFVVLFLKFVKKTACMWQRIKEGVVTLHCFLKHFCHLYALDLYNKSEFYRYHDISLYAYRKRQRKLR